MYIDNGIVAVDREHIAQKVSLAVQKDLQDAGFITNIEKSNWVPRRCATWLGLQNMDPRLHMVSGLQERLLKV